MPAPVVSRTPFADTGSVFSIHAATLDAVYQLLCEAGLVGAANLLVVESKRIISPLVWTLDDIRDKIPDAVDLLQAVDAIEDLGEWEHGIEVVNRQLDELVEQYVNNWKPA